jgi:hypothetical protein
MTGITERYVQGLGPTSSDDLAALLGADARHIRQTIEILEDAHILTECESQHFLPARPPEQITGQLVASAWRRVTAPLINRDTPGEAPINNGIDALTMALDIPLVPSRKAD